MLEKDKRGRRAERTSVYKAYLTKTQPCSGKLGSKVFLLDLTLGTKSQALVFPVCTVTDQGLPRKSMASSGKLRWVLKAMKLQAVRQLHPLPLNSKFFLGRRSKPHISLVPTPNHTLHFRMPGFSINFKSVVSVLWCLISYSSPLLYSQVTSGYLPRMVSC